MINAADNGAYVAATVSSTTASDNDPDAAAFARELEGSLMGEEATRRAVSFTLGRLSGMFPSAAITVEPLASFGDAVRHTLSLDAETSVNLEPELLEQMANDEELFTRVKDMISSLFAAGRSQNLVEVGGTSTQRSINITTIEARYVEVQRGADGTRLAVSSLLLETNRIISEALDAMLAKSQARFSGLDGLSAGPVQSWGFSGLISSTTSWRFESQVSSAGLQGMLQTSQNLTASIDLMIQTWEVSGEVDLFSYMQLMGLVDPLVLDLGDEGINLRSAEDGVRFDINGDGRPVETGFIQGNNAFLYLDKNGNGVVDDISELFGDFGGYANGFANLAQYDDNGDGVIDENDAIYSQLRLWRDLNGDGINQVEESMTLAEAGIKSINLNYLDDIHYADGSGNVIGEQSTFTRIDGSQGLIADVWLRQKK